MIFVRHLMMDKILHYQDEAFMMSISQLKEKFLPTSYSESYGFYQVIDKRFSWSNLKEEALPHIME